MVLQHPRFCKEFFRANPPEIHGARQICIQSYNINNVFLHFIISRRIHATFCTMVVFIPAALYSETSGLQPIKYAVRHFFRFWNILIIFLSAGAFSGLQPTKYAVRPGILQFPGLTYFLLPVPKSHGYPSFFSLLSSGFGVSRSYFSSVEPAPAFSRLSQRFLQ